ncbi:MULTISPECIES: transposase [Clostridium]|uniref:Transposase n=1 Tax=Clostridium faecium TaxID=2762223 RepID=A0ABR8YUK9_9CLOT|nr:MULTISPECIES: transposase [Clostridium]MBD8047884.1 transposase [Clostridium faecium]MDU1347849.1 transposase [Clostridium argentinense]
MARTARKLSESGIYHVMTRSFPDKSLFYDDSDKEKMLQILRKLQIEENFKVYAYCLMDTHTHFLININGGDLGKMMKKFNLRYGGYLRKCKNHKGPVFRDRYKSKPINNDEYLIEVSKYIHRNPIDIKAYRENPECYTYSSLSLYLGLEKNKFNLCDVEYIMSYFGKKKRKARENYYQTIFNIEEEKLKEMEFENDKSEYRSEKVILLRNCSEKEISNFVCKKIGIEEIELNFKYKRKSRLAKAIYVVFLTQFCGKSQKEICGILHNITQSNVSVLCKYGIELIIQDKFYQAMLDELINLNTKKIA